MSAKLSAARELSALVHTAAFQLRQVLGCSVVIFTKPGSEPLWIASANVGVPREDLLHVRYERGDNLIARLDAGEFVEDGDLPPRAVMVVPVRRREELIGMISLGRTPLGELFGDSERDLLAAMADQLGLHIENFRLRDQDWELSRVRELQERLLPKSQTGIKGYDVAHMWRPARSVSGDYFDIIDLGENKLAVCIGDVIGKGMPAALLMSNVQAAVKAVASPEMSPSELCARVNRVLAGNLAAGNFVTFFYSVIDGATGELTYTNAGHAAPILVRNDGTIIRLEDGGALLGVFKNWSFQQTRVELRLGDRLVLYTDGITELKNESEEEFGEDRVERVVARNREASAAEVKDRVLEAVSDFANGAFEDDVTVVVVAVN
jgi:sigma-B regulation protein RsbU (phosphoserine phosphatase)